jgi:hypothetical protein
VIPETEETGEIVGATVISTDLAMIAGALEIFTILALTLEEIGVIPETGETEGMVANNDRFNRFEVG